MANLMEGYLRVIGEKDAQRREQIWPVLANTESKSGEPVSAFRG
jgi:hypothetical protein